jgi:hypothetical protein
VAAAPGLFGSNGRSSFDFSPQLFKVPHLRNLYQKVGMFGNAENPGPNSNSIPEGPEGERQQRRPEAFIMAFPTNLAPAVGQQITLTGSSSAAVGSRIDLLRQRADAGECDLVAKTRIDDDEAGFLYVGSGSFLTDRRGQPPITDAGLRSLAAGHGRIVTYTCVPPGSGVRIGVDRDGDRVWDGDERRAHTDPADPDSRP